MRCTKCGKIFFDYLESCPSCNQDLKAVHEHLGGFIQPMSDLCWFDIENLQEDISAGVTAAAPEHGPVNLSDIDVSDLVSEPQEESVAEKVEIDPESLEHVAEDEDFQKALDEIIPGDT